MEEISPQINQRDILLVPFPFSDLSGQKVRPVLVVSKTSFNRSSEDVIVCAITSNLSKDAYSVLLRESDLDEGKLFSPCCVKIESIFKIHQRLTIKKIGKINASLFSTILKGLNSLFI